MLDEVSVSVLADAVAAPVTIAAPRPATITPPASQCLRTDLRAPLRRLLQAIATSIPVAESIDETEKEPTIDGCSASSEYERLAEHH
ncbi:hypothetical protein [Mycobacterium sp. NAZ190054]|uniref:hypothetical protein n=1 Tax=Mycobacterium sp. NAZ190054 TaxID=1747766 RepID=UPI0012E37397|nr:hypothetical protein [Mycobacterium sp. NAZ190054]